jgi:hypothetical protein
MTKQIKKYNTNGYNKINISGHFTLIFSISFLLLFLHISAYYIQQSKKLQNLLVMVGFIFEFTPSLYKSDRQKSVFYVEKNQEGNKTKEKCIAR